MIHTAGAPSRTTALAYLLAALIGTVFAAHLMTPASVLARDTLDQAYSLDRAQHIIGQRYFIADAWRWPLLLARPLGWPAGTNIALTDSIPLMAIPAKLLRGALPPGFNAVFLWLAIAYFAQPVAAVFALRGSGERRLVPALALAVIAISLPSFLYRFGHAALSAHFLLLLAIGAYLRTCAGSRRAAWAGPLLLLPISLLVHPYLMAMVASVLAAAPVSLLLSGRPWSRAGAGLLAGLAVLALSAWLLGYGGQAPLGGYGSDAMDLLSPFRPADATLWPAAGPLGPADSEGYQYLGTGLLVLMLAAATGALRHHVTPRHHLGLLLAALGLTALAVSTRVQIGHTVVFERHNVPVFLNQLRSSGRFFWPVAYTLMVGATVLVMRTLPPRWALPVMVLAATLQFIDATALRAKVFTAMHDGPRPWVIDTATLRPLLAAHRQLTLWPPYACGTGALDDPDFIQILLLASATTIRTNTMYVARSIDPVDCNALNHIATPLAPGELRVFLRQIAAGAPAMVPDGANLCRLAGPLAVCSRQPLPGLPIITPPHVPLDRKLAIGDPTIDAALGAGWASLEPDGIWTEGGRATISLHRPTAGALHLTLWGRGYAPPPTHTQQVTVYAGDQRIATWAAPAGGAVQAYQADIPPGDDTWLSLRLDIAQPTRPTDVDKVPDTRALGFFLQSFQIQK